jgi:hypothetical protein
MDKEEELHSLDSKQVGAGEKTLHAVEMVVQ